MVRERIQHGRFVQVYVKTPVHLAEQRDVKGLYKQARAGLIKNFTGIGSDYEVPTDSEVVIDTSTVDPQAAAHQILEYIGQRDWSQDAQS